MIKARLINLLGNRTTVTTARIMIVLSVLVVSLLTTGVVFAGPISGGVGT